MEAQMYQSLTSAQKETLNQLRKNGEMFYAKRGQVGFFNTCVPELLILRLAVLNGKKLRITELGLETLAVEIARTGKLPIF
jgi:hypothetical protein